jgi:hypothetical protein
MVLSWNSLGGTEKILNKSNSFQAQFYILGRRVGFHTVNHTTDYSFHILQLLSENMN